MESTDELSGSKAWIQRVLHGAGLLAILYLAYTHLVAHYDDYHLMQNLTLYEQHEYLYQAHQCSTRDTTELASSAPHQLTTALQAEISATDTAVPRATPVLVPFDCVGCSLVPQLNIYNCRNCTGMSLVRLGDWKTKADRLIGIRAVSDICVVENQLRSWSVYRLCRDTSVLYARIADLLSSSGLRWTSLPTAVWTTLSTLLFLRTLLKWFVRIVLYFYQLAIDRLRQGGRNRRAEQEDADLMRQLAHSNYHTPRIDASSSVMDSNGVRRRRGYAAMGEGSNDAGMSDIAAGASGGLSAVPISAAVHTTYVGYGGGGSGNIKARGD
jgi:hypothetical protein